MSFHLQSIKINCDRGVHDGMLWTRCQRWKCQKRKSPFVELSFLLYFPFVYHFETNRSDEKRIKLWKFCNLNTRSWNERRKQLREFLVYQLSNNSNLYIFFPLLSFATFQHFSKIPCWCNYLLSRYSSQFLRKIIAKSAWKWRGNLLEVSRGNKSSI